MSTAVSENSIRKINEGGVSFSDWEGLTDHEKAAAPSFEEGIENSFITFPPTLHVDATLDDVLLTFGIAAIGNGHGIGPAWEFSLKNVFGSFTDCHPDDVKILIAAMRSLADFAESLIAGS